MKAINFNRIAKTLEDGKVFDFHFISTNGTANDLTLWREGAEIVLGCNGNTTHVAIFRDALTVRDAIAIGLRQAGTATSGIYKADILKVIKSDYANAVHAAGVAGYHSSERPTTQPTDRAYYFGVELETECRTRETFDAAKNIASNMWRKERDGSLGEYGIEFISDLIRPEDGIAPDFYADLCDTLTGLAISKTTRRTGLHVHVSRTAFGSTRDEQDENIAKAVYLYESISEATKTAIFGRDNSGQYYAAIAHDSDARAVLTVARMDAAIMESGAVSRVYKDSIKRRAQGHYCEINTENRNTVEFRRGKGHINSAHIAKIVQFVYLLAKYASANPWRKLDAHRFYNSIPTTHKFNDLRACFTCED